MYSIGSFSTRKSQPDWKGISTVKVLLGDAIKTFYHAFNIERPEGFFSLLFSHDKCHEDFSF